MRGAEDTPRDPFRVLEHVHGLALFFARRAGVTAEPRRVSCQHPEREFASLSEYTSRHVIGLERFEEAKTLLRKMVPVARRVLGESNTLTLKMRWVYARALYKDDGATLDDLREAATTLEETERIARRVMGGLHPTTTGIENALRVARAVLRARETPLPGNA